MPYVARPASALVYSARVARNLWRLRRMRGLSLRAMADEMSTTGTPMSADGLNKLETRFKKTGGSPPAVTVDQLHALAAVLGVSIDVLLAEAPACTACHDAPPPGYACTTCGAQSPRTPAAAPE